MNNKEQIQALTRAIRNGQIKPENARGYWPSEEREELERAYYAGVGITECALRFGRSESAVFQQLVVMDLITPPGSKRTASVKSRDQCLCEKCKCEECLVKEKCREAACCAGAM